EEANVAHHYCGRHLANTLADLCWDTSVE
nr:bombyxin IV B [Bombyx mori]